MIRTDYIPLNKAWPGQPNADIVNSFKGGFRPCRIPGPARLVRLLSHAGQAPEGQMYGPNRLEGEFWFDEQDFLRIKSAAEADLKSQGRQDSSRNSLRLGMYLRHQFRSMLAVSRDWTPSFDYFARLTIPAQALVVGLVGTVKDQPVYSPDSPGAAGTDTPETRLRGGLTQYVIRFDFPPNKRALGWIISPLPF